MKRLAFILGFISACGHDSGEIDRLVGEACRDDGDCEHRCYTDSGRFPGGFCSLPCSRDEDCPLDTYCIDVSGGVCMFYCPEFDCLRLGQSWECKSVDRVGG